MSNIFLEMIAVLILKQLKNIVGQYYNDKKIDVVINVHESFNDALHPSTRYAVGTCIF